MRKHEKDKEGQEDEGDRWVLTHEYIDKQVRKEVEDSFQCLKPPYGTGLVSMYLLLEILDMLSNINEKLAMANINIQDVEQEVSKLNPEYK